MKELLKIIMLYLGIFAGLYLLNAFGGKCTTHQGKVIQKRIVKNSQGHPFFRVLVKNDSSVVQVQTQPYAYPTINVGDTVNYTIRKGLFIPNVIETYNATKK
jgi:hypothetical protein